MRPRFAGARKSQTLKKVNRAAESDDLQTQRLVRAPCFVLQSANEERAEPPVSVGWKQSQINAADFLLASFHERAAHGFALQQDDLIDSLRTFVPVEALLRLVLHIEKLADAVLVPAQLTQVFAAMNFLIDGPLLSTETRVHAASRAAAWKFGLYWAAIRAGSGILRRMWLRAIKRRAERG